MLAITFALGAAFGAASGSAARAETDAYGKLDIFAKVLHYVETNYVDNVRREDLVYGAIRGMLDTLDPHTVFMPPDVFQEMKIDTSGEFQGLGLIVESRDRRLVVITPIEDSPAAHAGVLKNDVIIAIDGKDTLDMELAQAVTLMRGPVGTKASLTLSREGVAQPLVVDLVRGHIRVASVEQRLLDKGVGYLKIKSFQDRTDAQAVKALQTLSRQNSGELTSLVLDLRGNPGGLLEEGVRFADEFLGDGLIVSTEGRNGQQVETARAHPSGAAVAPRLAVLVDEQSASAAEIVAGALQDQRRALLFGVTTYGKGSVQNIISLDDGSGLKITVARYFTPSRRPIEGVGVAPDVVVANPAALEQWTPEVDESGLAPEPPETDATGKKLLAALPLPKDLDPNDHQLRAAYAYLKLGELPK